MAYTIADTVLDEGLTYLKTNVTKLVVLSADPAGNYSNANTANGTGSGLKIAEIVVDSTDFTIAAGAVDGRKVTVGAQNGVAVTTAGDATHIAWLDVTNTAVLAVTQLTTTRSGLTTSDTLDIPAHYAAFRGAVVAS